MHPDPAAHHALELTVVTSNVDRAPAVSATRAAARVRNACERHKDNRHDVGSCSDVAIDGHATSRRLRARGGRRGRNHRRRGLRAHGRLAQFRIAPLRVSRDELSFGKKGPWSIHSGAPPATSIRPTTRISLPAHRRALRGASRLPPPSVVAGDLRAGRDVLGGPLTGYATLLLRAAQEKSAAGSVLISARAAGTAPLPTAEASHRGRSPLRCCPQPPRPGRRLVAVSRLDPARHRRCKRVARSFTKSNTGAAGREGGSDERHIGVETIP